MIFRQPLTFRQRISASFGLLIAFFAVNATIAITAIYSIHNRLEVTAAIEALSGTISRTGEYRLLFNADGSRLAEQNVFALISEADRQLAGLRNDAHGSKGLETIAAGLASLKEAFQRSVILAGQHDAVENRFMQLNQTITARIESFDGRDRAVSQSLTRIMARLLTHQRHFHNAFHENTTIRPQQPDDVRTLLKSIETAAGDSGRPSAYRIRLFRIARDIRVYADTLDQHLALLAATRTSYRETHATAGQLRQACEAVRGDITRRNNREVHLLLILLLLTSAASVVAAVFLARVLIRKITDPIIGLTDITRLVTGGDLRVRAPLTAADEIGELGSCINRMLDSIQQMEREIIERMQRINTLAQELALTEGKERSRIAGELHDQVGPSLLACMIKLHTLRGNHDTAEKQRVIQEIEEILDASIQELRSLTFQLRPPLLETEGLGSALTWLSGQFRERHGLQVDMTGNADDYALDYETRATIFQIIRELLLNAAKHAGTDRVEVIFSCDSGALHIDVTDQGNGFDPAALAAHGETASGFGMFNVRNKVDFLGGTLEVRSQPGAGTRIAITIPWQQRETP